MPTQEMTEGQLEIVLQKYKDSIAEANLTAYEYDEVLEKAKAYFIGDDLAASVWVSKYAKILTHLGGYNLDI